MMPIGIDLKGLGDIFTGAGSLAKDIRSAITGDISPEKKAELEAKALELESASMNAQAEINKVEASSASLFVAGWRPAFGWLGVLVVAMVYIVNPILSYFGIKVVQTNMSDLFPIITGILGLGGMRSYEKSRGVEGRH